jgi:hypothetical protein
MKYNNIQNIVGEQDDNSFLKEHSKIKKVVGSSNKQFLEGMYNQGKFQNEINSFNEDSQSYKSSNSSKSLKSNSNKKDFYFDEDIQIEKKNTKMEKEEYSILSREEN